MTSDAVTTGDGKDVIVFVGGCDRSGTTVVSRIIGERANLVVLPEAYFHAVAYRKFGATATAAQGLRHWRRRSWGLSRDDRRAGDGPLATFMTEAMNDMYEARRGVRHPTRVVESTPENIEVASTLLEQFPHSHMVHVIRDPRAVVNSLRNADFGPTTAQECARFWKQRVASGLAAEAAFPGRVTRVRYEAAMTDPAVVDSIAHQIADDDRFLWEPDRDLLIDTTSRAVQARVPHPVDTSRTEAWRSRLSDTDVGTIEYECRELMQSFGYVCDGHTDARSSFRRQLDSLRSALAEPTTESIRRAARIIRSRTGR